MNKLKFKQKKICSSFISTKGEFMLVSPINTQQYNNIYTISNFRSTINIPKNAGRLKSRTVRNVDSVLNAYRDIASKLECKTSEGIKFIQENFANIEIGEGLLFHNCGEDKTSILIRVAESLKNIGLTRIIERQSSSSWGNKIVKNSFLLEHNEKLVKTDGRDNHLSYPKERNYYTEEEISDLNLDENLNKVLENLDSAMLTFRIFLAKNADKHTKLPTGKLPYSTCSLIKKLENLIQETNTLLKDLPAKVSLDARHLFDGYKMVTGSPSHVFENVGSENVKIKFYPINSQLGSNLNRLSVYDETDKLLHTFVISNDGKMVKNLTPNFDTALPQTLVYADEAELLNEKFKPAFEKYLNLYYEKFISFNKHIKEYCDTRLKKMKSEPLELSQKEQYLLNEIQKTLIDIQQKLKTFDSNTSANIKKSINGLFAPPGRKGLTFDDSENNRRIFILPLKTRNHSGLVRFTITNSDSNEQSFLIKDNKYIVKNYNPKYPQVIPPNLIYAKQIDTEIDLNESLNFLYNNAVMYKEILEKEIGNRTISRQEKIKEKELNKSKLKSEKQEIKNKAPELKEENELKVQLQKKKDETRQLRIQQKIKTTQEKEKKKLLLKTCSEQLTELKRNINNSNERFIELALELRNKLDAYLNPKIHS